MTNKTTYSYVQINFRILAEHAKLIGEAAASHGEKVAGYCRRVMIEWAAADLGRELPDMSEYSGDIISNAAKKLGMSAQEFTNMVARESAAKVLMGETDNSVIVGRLSNELRATLHGGRSSESGERLAAGIKRR